MKIQASRGGILQGVSALWGHRCGGMRMYQLNAHWGSLADHDVPVGRDIGQSEQAEKAEHIGRLGPNGYCGRWAP